MRRALFLAVVLLTAGLAGCIGSDDAGIDPTGASAAEARTLDAPPDLQVGDWWEIQMTSELWDEPRTVTRVVAGVEDGHYILGVAQDEWDPVLLFNHIPGLGEVSQGNLSFDMHDRDFRPVDFPLTEGKSWETTYDGVEVEATVTSTEDDQARIHYCCTFNLTATYDPSMGALARLEESSDDAYEVVDHGTGWEGTVVVPRGQDLVFLTYDSPIVTAFSQEPNRPATTVEVADEYDRLMLGQLAGPFGVVDQPASSAYVERAEAPDGTTYETTNGPTETQMTEKIYEVEDPGGTWSFEHVAPGVGWALSEGVAYDRVEVELGTGPGSGGPEEATRGADLADGAGQVPSR